MKFDRTRKPQFSALQVIGAYVGTVVGAGFASGQEILQFFASFGNWGLAGLGLATALFIGFGYLILRLGNDVQATSHKEVIYRVSGRWVGYFTDGTITAFLLGAFVIMASGAGALFAEQLGLPKLLGSSVLVVASVLAVLAGLGGVVSAISVFVPLLLGSGALITALTLWKGWENFLANLGWSHKELAPAPWWALTAALYASYNLVMAAPVLAPVGASARRDMLFRSSVLGGGLLGLGATAIYVNLLAGLPDAARLQVPMLAAAGSFLPILRPVYALILFSEIFTTAVGNLYGFVRRLAPVESPKYVWLTLLTAIFSLLAAQVGFSRLVSIVFPAVGWAGLVFLASLAYYFFAHQGGLALATYLTKNPELRPGQLALLISSRVRNLVHISILPRKQRP